MREKEFIEIIKDITKSPFIGDDCAVLEDFGMVVTQDNLIEDVHFSQKFCTPFELGFKSVMVNISDICASGAKPKYITIGLSVPKDCEKSFIQEFYKGCKKACGNDVQIIGGDLTAADKIMISVCAIGCAKERNLSSRKDAQIGQKVVISGVHGSSAAGLFLLQNDLQEPKSLINAHLCPVAQVDFSKKISQNIKTPYAMMDTSDGLMDALTTIAQDSEVLLEIDFDKIPYDRGILSLKNWQEYVLFGGEDYQLVATVPEDFKIGHTIGKVSMGSGVSLKKDNEVHFFSRTNIEGRLYNHFG